MRKSIFSGKCTDRTKRQRTEAQSHIALVGFHPRMKLQWLFKPAPLPPRLMRAANFHPSFAVLLHACLPAYSIPPAQLSWRAFTLSAVCFLVVTLYSLGVIRSNPLPRVQSKSMMSHRVSPILLTYRGMRRNTDMACH